MKVSHHYCSSSVIKAAAKRLNVTLDHTVRLVVFNQNGSFFFPHSRFVALIGASPSAVPHIKNSAIVLHVKALGADEYDLKRMVCFVDFALAIDAAEAELELSKAEVQKLLHQIVHSDAADDDDELLSDSSSDVASSEDEPILASKKRPSNEVLEGAEPRKQQSQAPVERVDPLPAGQEGVNQFPPNQELVSLLEQHQRELLLMIGTALSDRPENKATTALAIQAAVESFVAENPVVLQEKAIARYAELHAADIEARAVAGILAANPGTIEQKAVAIYMDQHADDIKAVAVAAFSDLYNDDIRDEAVQLYTASHPVQMGEASRSLAREEWLRDNAENIAREAQNRYIAEHARTIKEKLEPSLKAEYLRENKDRIEREYILDHALDIERTYKINNKARIDAQLIADAKAEAEKKFARMVTSGVAIPK